MLGSYLMLCCFTYLRKRRHASTRPPALRLANSLGWRVGKLSLAQGSSYKHLQSSVKLNIYSYSNNPTAHQDKKTKKQFDFKTINVDYCIRYIITYLLSHSCYIIALEEPEAVIFLVFVRIPGKSS